MVGTNIYREPDDIDTDDYKKMSESQLTFLKSDNIKEDSMIEDYPDYDFPKNTILMDIVGVKLYASGPVVMFDCQNMYFDQNDRVVVETERGLVLGEVVVPGRRMMANKEKLQRVIRKATTNDMRQRMRNREREDTAYRLCKSRILELKLQMKLIKVEYLHGGNKAIFYFSADGRIDFRELVRDLARRLHTRIEMRQVGVRDASRMIGGVGICGCQLCCNMYLREFKPISIKMAKDQNLVLNPQKVSGVCGRLLCCLTYEDKTYREAAKDMPRIGRRVITPDGEGKIRDRDVLKRVVRVLLSEENTMQEYHVDQLEPAPNATDNSRSGKSSDTGDKLERDSKSPKPDTSASKK
jgi:cell fate regulator YaaT (PSP1 superfamily)